MKKKLLSLVLVAAMVMGLSMNALAATTVTFDSRQDKTPGTNPPYVSEQEVKINVTPHDPAKVYYVVVDWENTEFLYDFVGAPTWNPENHTYIAGNEAKWDKTSANIKVTNHSNAAVAVNTTFKETNATSMTKNEVTGTIETANFDLQSGEGFNFTTAPSGTSTLKISGTPNVTGQFTLGTVNVTISAK